MEDESEHYAVVSVYTDGRPVRLYQLGTYSEEQRGSLVLFMYYHLLEELGGDISEEDEFQSISVCLTPVEETKQKAVPMFFNQSWSYDEFGKEVARLRKKAQDEVAEIFSGFTA